MTCCLAVSLPIGRKTLYPVSKLSREDLADYLAVAADLSGKGAGAYAIREALRSWMTDKLPDAADFVA
jgi:hypothetical protein